jgi:hypothetical protein
VLLVTVSVAELALAMPPPLWVAPLLKKVLSVMLRSPRLAMAPPYSPGVAVVLPENMLLVTVALLKLSLKMPPPSSEEAVLPEKLQLVIVSVPLLRDLL